MCTYQFSNETFSVNSVQPVHADQTIFIDIFLLLFYFIGRSGYVVLHVDALLWLPETRHATSQQLVYKRNCYSQAPEHRHHEMEHKHESTIFYLHETLTAVCSNIIRKQASIRDDSRKPRMFRLFRSEFSRRRIV